MNNDLSVTPDSPTISGMEMQSKPSFLKTTATATTPANPPANTAQPSTVTTPKTTSIHVTALDGFVNVNSLFTMAIFIGFSLTVPSSSTAGTKSQCTTSNDTVRRLIVVEVISFSFFLFSSLMAQSLKLSINLLNGMDQNDPHKADIDPNVLKYGLFASATGSVMGCLFLMLSIVDFIQVKLGKFSCGGEPLFALVPLVICVGSAILIYMSTAIYVAFFVEITSKDSTQQG